MKDLSKNYTKWVACWGNATSITDQKESLYSKDITLRYPVYMCFDGNKIRLHLSNLTGSQDVVIDQVFVALSSSPTYTPVPVRNNGQTSIHIPKGKEIVTDEVDISIHAGDYIDVSFYLKDYTQMNSGTLITGPLSTGKYSYGNYAANKQLPLDFTRNTNWFYFLNTIDIYTKSCNRAIICYGDSITAQSWPDYLTLRCKEQDYNTVAIIRRAVSGTRILRQYDCITYKAYGLKGEVRFPIEMECAGADTVIIQHGINDIIHPVGSEVNPFRPWSDMPDVKDLTDGILNIYVSYAKSKGYKVYCGTLLPIKGWRTYTTERDFIRTEFNNWIRSNKSFDGCIDFDKAVRDSQHPEQFALGFDSGDHLHPSELAYKAMANCIPDALLKSLT